MKRLLSLIITLCAVLTGMADANWKMHTTFDEPVTRIVDTPHFVYFTSRTQPYNAASKYIGEEFLSLFRYDKDNDELLSLSTDNLLSTNTVQEIGYSPETGCLAVVHHSGDIDFLYDDGRAETMDDYRIANVNGTKRANSISFDEKNSRIYIGTQFGYIAVNAKKREIAESRTYGQPVNGMVRLGDKLLLSAGNDLLLADASDPRFSLEDYQKAASFPDATQLHILSDNKAVLATGEGNGTQLHIITLNDNRVTSEKVASGEILNIERNSNGVTATVGGKFIQIRGDGSMKATELPEEERHAVAASRNGNEFWFGKGRRGIWSLRQGEGTDWAVTHAGMAPDAPSPWRVSDMEWHKDHGMMVANHGTDYLFHHEDKAGPLLVSALDAGSWSNLAPVYTAPELPETFNQPNGLAIDPKNPDYAYFGSFFSGLKRVNLKDGTDVIHLSRTDDPGKGARGFLAIVDNLSGNPSPSPNMGSSWKVTCPFSAPRFDYYGNMWVSYYDSDDQQEDQLHLFCWTPEDRLASTPDDITPPKRVKVKGSVPNSQDEILPLKVSGQRNLIIHSNRHWPSDLSIIDTKGTPTDGSDDELKHIVSFHDQDGVEFEVARVQSMYEDPATGYVWVLHLNGVFWFNPKKLFDGTATNVNRIKVSRNDGTNLADYLLDGVCAYRMAIDGKGRKWFSTNGAGIICTSSDGRTIEEEFTAENSPLPSSTVYGIAYNPEGNSLMISTERGLCEYFLPGNASGGEMDSVRAYPNPVRPEYAGYVTIDGLPAGSLVKIADAGGNVVKELGAAQGGEVKWDVTNAAFKRVSSGVYFILASSGEGDSSMASVGKILVVN